MSRCGALVLEDVYGMSNVEDGVPLQPDAIFRLMSMSKPITAAAAMICYEAGYYQCAALPSPILSLSSSLRLCCCRMDDPLSMYLPEWGETKVFAGGTADEPLLVEQERPITIKHLAALSTPHPLAGPDSRPVSSPSCCPRQPARFLAGATP